MWDEDDIISEEDKCPGCEYDNPTEGDCRRCVADSSPSWNIRDFIPAAWL